MFVPFNSISPSSRIWIFQSDRKLTATEITYLHSHLRSFTERWAAHGQPLRASFDILYDQFIALAADEAYNSASGCSIDDSVRAIKQIEEHLQVGLFNRNIVAFKKSEDVVLVTLRDLKEKYEQGTWNGDTPTFNNLVSLKNQLETDWIVPAKNTWLKRYIPSVKIAHGHNYL